MVRWVSIYFDLFSNFETRSTLKSHSNKNIYEDLASLQMETFWKVFFMFIRKFFHIKNKEKKTTELITNATSSSTTWSHWSGEKDSSKRKEPDESRTKLLPYVTDKSVLGIQTDICQ